MPNLARKNTQLIDIYIYEEHKRKKKGTCIGADVPKFRPVLRGFRQGIEVEKGPPDTEGMSGWYLGMERSSR